MLKNYFKIAWRNIIRHKGYSAINIAGLTVGIAACLLIFVIIKFELSFNTFNPNYKNIYRITTRSKSEAETTTNPGAAVPATEALRLDFPQAKVAALNSSYGSQLTVPEAAGSNAGDKKFIESIGVLFIQPQFFDIFSYKWLAGSASALVDPDMVVLDKTTAAKYFGDWHSAMGKIVRMDNVLTLKVAGVVEDAPANSDFPFKVMISFVTWKQHAKAYDYNDDWHSTSSSHEIFMLFPPDMSQANIDAQFKAFSAKHFKKDNHSERVLVPQPLADMHFDKAIGNPLGDHSTSMATLRTLSFIGLLIIIMASINFINLSTAQSVGRSKEVGIRKVLGSTRPQLILQVIGETTIIVIISALFAIGVARLVIPQLKNIANVPDDISLFSAGSVLFLIISVAAIILLSGVYPALVVSGFKPVLALKNKITAASIGGIPLRRALVIAQFAISQLLIIGTIVAVNQMDFVNNADLGFNKNALLIIPGYTDSVSLGKMESFKYQLLQNKNVKAVSFSSDVPSSENNWGTNFYFNNSNKDIGFSTFMKFGDADYFKTYGLKFVAGKGYDVSDTVKQYVVNETFIHKLGIQNPEEAIGKMVRLGGGHWKPIVGVVQDFKTNSLRDAIKPMVISSSKGYEAQVGIKIETGNLSKTVAELKKLWESTYPEYAYNGYFFDESIARFYEQENKMALVYKVFAGIAIFISCLGLYGLVSFMAVQRTKEVGVRKVLGASVTSIVFLFSKEFMILIGISFIIAMPAAWYIMNGWLQNFVYRISMSVWIFVLAIASSLVIAWITVGYKAVKAALANPVKSLRSE
ncbi:FtsX-like permease family protein [Mucilaginibacter oryzae]|uniref:FtsX-like permease family protein n=1 Tax=Mucilaginibacter oryzae TaxID=468058 RepID=A0A316HCD3_9SPHI|nr:ABC transporter permease [Mucilaginibacter oryzae]PWK78869.1 FtsX-like permease family protein [Mucilaginibacter oryzae]